MPLCYRPTATIIRFRNVQLMTRARTPASKICLVQSAPFGLEGSTGLQCLNGPLPALQPRRRASHRTPVLADDVRGRPADPGRVFQRPHS